jgi:hypothetical protein
MEEAIAGIVGAVLGVLAQGVVDFFRFKQRTARKDHEHRQAYYHDAQVSADALIELSWHTPPSEAAGVQQVVEAQFKRQIKGIRTFGNRATRQAARELEDAWEDGDEQGMRDAAKKLEDAGSADVAPK